MSGTSAPRNRSACEAIVLARLPTQRDEQALGQVAGRCGKCLDGERPAQQHLGRAARFPEPECGDGPARSDRTDAVEQLQQAEPGQLVARVVGQAERTEQVLHVGGLEVAEAAVLHVRDPTTRQLELQEVAVMGGTHEHCLASQRDPVLPVDEHPFADRGDLRVLVAAADQLRSSRRARPMSAAAPGSRRVRPS